MSMNQHMSSPNFRIFSCRAFLSCFLLTANVTHADSDISNHRVAKGLDLSLPEESFDRRAMERPNFTGIWLLDTSAGDDPDTLVNASIARPNKPSFPRGAGMPGPGPGTGNKGFGPPPAGGMGEARGSVKPPINGLWTEHLEIHHSEPELILIADQTDEQRILTDYRRSIISRLGGIEQMEVTAGWQNDVLVIEIHSPTGDIIAQRLRLLEDPRRLERVTLLPSHYPDGKPMKLKQIFTQWVQ